MATVRIPLGNNKGFALIDEEDYLLVSKHSWHIFPNPRTDYAVTTTWDKGKKETLRLHRLIAGDPNGFDIDHINGNGLDCRRQNLRVATRSQNAANQKIQRRSKSGYKGVTFHKGQGKWNARIGCARVQHHIGCFDNPVDAAHAYDAKARELFGEYALLNFPRDTQ